MHGQGQGARRVSGGAEMKNAGEMVQNHAEVALPVDRLGPEVDELPDAW